MCNNRCAFIAFFFGFHLREFLLLSRHIKKKKVRLGKCMPLEKAFKKKKNVFGFFPSKRFACQEGNATIVEYYIIVSLVMT